MKMMKKITAILLALFMLPYTALASKTEEKPAQNSGVYELLVSLGIVEDTFGFKYDKGITRMEFARVVIKAGGFDSQDVAPVGLFRDVPADNEYAKDIEFLASINVVSGGSDGNFYPNRMVKLEEAVAMLLRIAGYDDLVSMEQKSYPDNYMTVAKRFDLLDKVTIGTDVISGDNMLMLVYNMLSLNTFGFDKTTTVKLDKADTILSKVHNVYYRRGIVTSNSVTALNSRSEVSKAGITLETDDEIVEIAAGNTDIESMIGRNVTVYYRYDEKEDVSECLYYERTKKNEETVINLDFIGELNNSLIEYTIEDSGKEKKIKLDSPSIIYNQGYYSGSLLDENSFGGMTGTITAIDNDADGYYDVLVIEAYNTYVVKNAVSPQKTFYDKQTNAEVKIDPDDFDKFEMKYSDGGEAVFDDLVAGTVVSVAKTSPTSQAKAACVILSNKKISGMVTDAYDDGINSYVELDGTDIYIRFCLLRGM